MRYMVIILAVILGACGKAPSQMPADVQPFYDDFVSLVSEKHIQEGGTIRVLENVKTGSAAVCITQFGQPWQIQINQNNWENMNANEKRGVIFHELTHCLFDSKVHSEDSNSYMAPSANLSLDPDMLDAQVKEFTKSL